MLLARDVYSRACSIHLKNKPSMHLSWAVFEEKHGEHYIECVCKVHSSFNVKL